MKVVVAGSRTITYSAIVVAAIRESGFQLTELVSGGCRGVDRVAEQWAYGMGIPIRRFIPDWSHYGRSAGPRRNRQMAEYADAGVVVWDGKSRGRKNMAEELEKLGKPVHLVNVNAASVEAAYLVPFIVNRKKD